MDLSKEDLVRIEHALTRQSWRTEPVNDLLFRVRTELLTAHGVRVSHEPPAVPDMSGPLRQPDPTRTKSWPDMSSSPDDHA